MMYNCTISYTGNVPPKITIMVIVSDYKLIENTQLGVFG
ncbi:hypothetical protein Bcoa_0829 [Heyndrickxia coagulans 36D1]|jgi:hypothetical protein|uniref:Uncharacterized protein n=1 Tax=Heyndrickxia coagulans 36D1 TaxID=345219 RepID=G2TQX1_HEYCO|nr:hypothetical protein Bcoa_0829 [Heyndrickxia coagulans 36D1]